MPVKPFIEVRDLTKKYNGFTAVNAISFTVNKGECVALLGPNGAGKTSAIRVITCFSPATGGIVRVCGLDAGRSPRAIKARMGICQQEDNLDPDFTVRRNLTCYARYFGIPQGESVARADQLLDDMGLTEKADSQIPTLSGGMKRRLMLARALINSPLVLVLDEPTTGLDPHARQLIWKRVRQLMQLQNVTVLLTTHYMEEASQLADRVILMDNGKILLEGKPDAMIHQQVGREVVELWNPVNGVEEFVKQKQWPYQTSGGRTIIYDSRGGDVAPEIEKRFPKQERLLRHATLEDVFLRKTGHSLKD